MKSERGSITLFVLIAMIFFVAIAMTAYVSASSKLQGQNAELERIKASYEQDLSEEGLANLYKQLTTAKTETKTKPTAEDYGDYIEYGTAGTGLDLNGDGNVTNDWRIFYSNNDGVFIIAADYVPYSNTILQTAMNSSHANMANKTAYDGTEGYPYSAYWPKASYLTHTTIDSKSSIFLNEWASTENNNGKATASLLNTNAWSGFATGATGALAIGGPTLNMYIASWNEKGYTTLYANYDNIGYYIGTAENPSTYANESDWSGYRAEMSSDIEGYANTLYYPYQEVVSKCNGYWIASPSASGNDYMRYVRYDGRNGGILFNSGFVYSFRPVVYLPSSIQLKENSNGIWQIVKETKPELASTNETKPWLPTGCEITNNDLSTGVTIKDSNDNEWTWVVVPKSLTANAANDTAIETALRTYCTNNGISTTKVWSGGTLTFTDTWHDGCGLTEAQYAEKKSKMLNSIKNNGGFWIGKYEVGYTSGGPRSYGSDISTEHPLNQTPVIKKNAYPYNYIRCSQAEGLSESLTSGLGGTGSLMYGIQWDLALVYLKLNASVDPNNSTSWGNHLDSSFTITNTSAQGTTNADGDVPIWNAITSNPKDTAMLLTTGALQNTNKLNIYDLAGNLWEHTLEYTSYGSKPCASRGGFYNANGGSGERPAADYANLSITSGTATTGFRPVLY